MGVSVSGKNWTDSKYAALKTFSDAGLPANVMECCKNFSKPSPIQSNAWPFLLDGRDFVGIAATGSGEVFVPYCPSCSQNSGVCVPALMHILKKKEAGKLKKPVPRCLVLSPTRELAQQIADVLCDAGNSCGVKSVCVYGGTSKGPQISSLKSGVDIVIATPGRLKDLIEMGVCNLKDVSFAVLDEADRMLDMGFEPEVRSILSQTCSTVHQLAQEFMDPDPVKVLDDQSRDKRLVSLLEKYHTSKRLEGRFRSWRQGSECSYGGSFLIATDVASRGLDIPDVEVVINYSFPLTTEDYVHRIGRTGRAGKKGVAHTFFMRENKGLAGELVNVLREAGQIESKLYGSHFKEIGIDAPKSTKITFDNSEED
ncbi:unnamed protein product [Spirodela intermedia]|uniref:RNA helicase n=1 Tax=Spirodela intermedia TaxID=51605 RepID=A0A7I8JUA6_SPIIN|nr:unnamed protein product [Spirodela intermedia]CAA6673770.1 unnamed protein product [Spirodela intermedia]